MLAQRPLGPRAIADVLWNAARQQIHLGELWIVAGVPVLLFNLYQYPVLILYPPPYQQDFFSPGPLAAMLGALLYLSVGFWTVRRNGPTATRGGAAVFKMSLLINWPTSLIAVLAATGILRILAIGPGDAVTTFHEHGFAITLYDAARRPPALFGLFIMPLLNACEGYLWGFLGGAATCLPAHFRRLFHR